ncbi:hypothetical protein BY996DRAFT_4583076 [Phakopsora pachyrhizi]|uniref:Calpain catalytic domain-containing protein n=1 Tax=Phakopsora pachyrhizi TaxID=170000 RepID=A0AAV0BHI9_PHAPC|nr:hypothetical protein BY996DRAFT_4583076 [Phakopsora pachyrhizi]CAH7686030.1 hypothetical protein PPACK8108_LOCUS20627 [Phakopsora pachyrhizi]
MELNSLSDELRFKLKEAQSIAKRAATSETQTELGEAFKLYIESAQKYLYLIRNVSDGPLKDRLKDISSKLLNRAEKIKANRPLLKPGNRNRISLEEQDLVLNTSQRINGRVFKPWPNSTSSFANKHSHDLKFAKQQLPLSKTQRERLLTWKSIREIDSNCSMFGPKTIDPTDIVQDFVTDCSLIAAFAVSVTHSNIFNSNLHVLSLYPKSSDGRLNQDGIYRIKLLLNGIEREVSQRIVSLAHINSKHFTKALQSAHILKVALLFGLQLLKKQLRFITFSYYCRKFILSLFLDIYFFPIEDIIASFFYFWGDFCDCLVTAGTNGNITESLQFVGLVPFHDYAIIDIQEDTSGKRVLTLYNAWKSDYSDVKAQAFGTEDLRNSLTEKISSRRELTGKFPVSWESLQIYFDAIYLNWNPKLFEFKNVVHFSNQPLPNLRIKLKKCASSHKFDSEIWLILTRHCVDNRTHREKYVSFRVFLEDDGSSGVTSDFIRSPVASTALSNSSNLMIRMTPSNPKDSFLVHFSFHDDSKNGPGSDDQAVPETLLPIGFTLQIYSSYPVDLEDAGSLFLKFTEEVTGRWTAKTAGGNHSLSTYMNNPMWRITIENKNQSATGSSNGELKRANFRASLTFVDDQKGTVLSKSLNLKLARAAGDGRLYDVDSRDLVADSGSYTLNGAELRANQLTPGQYTIVPSTFESGTIGSFKLRLESDLPMVVKSIGPEGAGMYKRVGSSSWLEDKKFKESRRNWILRGGRGIVKSKIRLRAFPENGQYTIKLTLKRNQFSNLNGIKDGEGEGRIIHPGIFSNSISGASIGPIQLDFTNEQTNYEIIVESLGDNCVNEGSGYELIVYVEQPLTLDR